MRRERLFSAHRSLTPRATAQASPACRVASQPTPASDRYSSAGAPPASSAASRGKYQYCGDRGSAVLTRSQVPWIRTAGTDAVSLLISMRVGGGWAAGVLTIAWLTKAGMHA